MPSIERVAVADVFLLGKTLIPARRQLHAAKLSGVRSNQHASGAILEEPLPIGAWHTPCANPVVRTQDQGLLVLVVFFVTQVADGTLTYWGVRRFGLDVELNFYLAWFMGAVGPGLALFAAKALACVCGLILFRTAWLRTLAVATGWCIGFALVPWVFLATVLS
jgi:hypothetical protein